jgi:hypothetical protein
MNAKTKRAFVTTPAAYTASLGDNLFSFIVYFEGKCNPTAFVTLESSQGDVIVQYPAKRAISRNYGGTGDSGCRLADHDHSLGGNKVYAVAPVREAKRQVCCG